jgi:hypothetical protein
VCVCAFVVSLIIVLSFHVQNLIGFNSRMNQSLLCVRQVEYRLKHCTMYLTKYSWLNFVCVCVCVCVSRMPKFVKLSHVRISAYMCTWYWSSFPWSWGRVCNRVHWVYSGPEISSLGLIYTWVISRWELAPRLYYVLSRGCMYCVDHREYLNFVFLQTGNTSQLFWSVNTLLTYRQLCNVHSCFVLWPVNCGCAVLLTGLECSVVWGGICFQR